MIKWIHSSEKKWNCPHVNKCDVLVEQDGKLFPWNTDLPEPIGINDEGKTVITEYKYVYFVDLLEGFSVSMGRTYEPCNCQPDRSKREDDGRKCKHHGKFIILMPIESDSTENINQLRKTNNLKAFLDCHVLEQECFYDELDEKNKKIVDEIYAEQYNEFPSMRCSEHCGNTVREVQ